MYPEYPYKAPDPNAEATKILHSLLKVEGAVIIEAIHQIVRIADAEYQAMVQARPAAAHGIDLVYGQNLQVYYNRGVRTRLHYLLEDLKTELPGEGAKGVAYLVDSRTWTGHYSQEKGYLESVATTLRTLLDQL